MFTAKTLKNYIDILHAYAKLLHDKDYIKCITIVNNTVNAGILKIFLFKYSLNYHQISGILSYKQDALELLNLLQYECPYLHCPLRCLLPQLLINLPFLLH